MILASPMAVCDDTLGRLPSFLPGLSREPVHARRGVVDHGGERLVDFMGDRRPSALQRGHSRDMGQLCLGTAQRIFGLLALDELPDLAAMTAIISSSSRSGCRIFMAENSMTPRTSPPSRMGTPKAACNASRPAMGARRKSDHGRHRE